MTDVSMSIHIARPPMRVPFRHAAHNRAEGESVLVTLSARGETGWGEGAPRSYVTGETAATAAAALERLDLSIVASVLEAASFDDAVDRIAATDWAGAAGGQAAGAAAELACDDLLCRLWGRPVVDLVERLLPPCLRERNDAIRAATVLGLGADIRALSDDAARGAAHHVKLKGDRDPRRTIEAALEVRSVIGGAVPISIDANNAWTPEQLSEVSAGVPWVSWYEEPLAPRSWAALREARAQLGIRVMLDDSAVSAEDVATAIAEDAMDLVNVRVSRCGGLAGAVRMIRQAARAGKRVALGVHPGEVGPLFAAGRALAATTAGVVAIEVGRQDEWFDPPLTVPSFEVDRWRNLARPLAGPGLGVRPSAALSALLVPIPLAEARP